jgi:hypothetical protein
MSIIILSNPSYDLICLTHYVRNKMTINCTENISKKEWVLEMSRCIGSYFARKQFAVMREVTINVPEMEQKVKPDFYKPGNYRLDIVAINRQFEVIIVETKSCRADFQSDEKWQNYMPLCNKFYFAADAKTATYISDTLKSKNFKNVGVIAVRQRKVFDLYSNVRVIKPARTHQIYFDERELLWRMAARGSGYNFIGNYFNGNSFEPRTSLMNY